MYEGKKIVTDWIYQNEPVTAMPDDVIGFVYIITNLCNNRKYIGKKLSKFTRTSYKTVKYKNGNKKKRKVRTKVDSDWRDYWSSSEELKKDIAATGQEHFKREILFYCMSKAECTYVEAREQFERKVLESEEYYNGQISCKIHKSHIRGKIAKKT